MSINPALEWATVPRRLWLKSARHPRSNRQRQNYSACPLRLFEGLWFGTPCPTLKKTSPTRLHRYTTRIVLLRSMRPTSSCHRWKRWLLWMASRRCRSPSRQRPRTTTLLHIHKWPQICSILCQAYHIRRRSPTLLFFPTIRTWWRHWNYLQRLLCNCKLGLRKWPHTQCEQMQGHDFRQHHLRIQAWPA